MTHANDTLEAGGRRLLEVTANTTIDVYEPTESITQGEGYSRTYPGSATQSGLVARAESPSEDESREQRGTDLHIDRVYVVRDDAYSGWSDFGESGEAATRIEDTETGDRYDVEAVTDTRDGRLRLQCAEV